MECLEILTEISKKLGLGVLVKKPRKLYGGFMHKMYKLNTERGVYAIKLLNPLVMMREEAIYNFKKAEFLEQLLQDSYIPIEPALVFNGVKMQSYENQYYYIFNWADGKVLKSQEITKENCIIIGKLLAKIHNINQKNESTIKEDCNFVKTRKEHSLNNKCISNQMLSEDDAEEVVTDKKLKSKQVYKYEQKNESEEPKQDNNKNLEINWDFYIEMASKQCEETKQDNNKNLEINWDFYIEMASKQCEEVVDLLIENKSLYLIAQKETNIFINKLPNISCICHGDMDSKNVLWKKNKPTIIDLECLNYGNPYLELAELALSWSGFEHCKLNYDLMESFIEAYIRESKNFKVNSIDWNIFCCTNKNRLQWLEYNIKRALMIECGSEEEKQLGIEQVKETTKLIKYFSQIKRLLLERLNTKFN